MDIQKSQIIFLFILLMIMPLILTGTINAADHREAPIVFTSLSGDEEVPPVDTRARGELLIFITPEIVRDQGDEISYRLIVTSIENVAAAHLHIGAQGENGPVVAFLYMRDSDNGDRNGRFNGVLAEGIITADDLVGPLTGNPLSELIREMEAGNIYVNVHTVQNPPGEIRGQLTDPFSLGDR